MTFSELSETYFSKSSDLPGFDNISIMKNPLAKRLKDFSSGEYVVKIKTAQICLCEEKVVREFRYSLPLARLDCVIWLYSEHNVAGSDRTVSHPCSPEFSSALKIRDIIGLCT